MGIRRRQGAFPAAVDPAGEDLAVPLDGQADLAGGERPGQAVHELAKQVGDDRRRQAGRVGVDEEEQGLVREERAAFREEIPEVVLEAPHLARAAPAEGRAGP